jgi:hypothetical protein
MSQPRKPQTALRAPEPANRPDGILAPFGRRARQHPVLSPRPAPGPPGEAGRPVPSWEEAQRVLFGTSVRAGLVGRAAATATVSSLPLGTATPTYASTARIWGANAWHPPRSTSARATMAVMSSRASARNTSCWQRRGRNDACAASHSMCGRRADSASRTSLSCCRLGSAMASLDRDNRDRGLSATGARVKTTALRPSRKRRVRGVVPEQSTQPRATARRARRFQASGGRPLPLAPRCG